MPAEFDRCVKKVKAKAGTKGGKAYNPYAICRDALGSDADIRKRKLTRARSR